MKFGWIGHSILLFLFVGLFSTGAAAQGKAEKDKIRIGYAARAVTHEQYVAAFYTTWLFKLERWILQLVSKPSSDVEATRLARGEIERFAAWSVEGRAEDQMLLCDYTGRTRSWLSVRDASEGGAPRTRLYFGSAVVPRAGEARLGFPFDLLLDFHKAYSVALLRAARARLKQAGRAATSP